MDDDVGDAELLFTYMAIMLQGSCIAMNPPIIPSLGSVDKDESLALGDEEVEELLSLFFTVEFQKFFISLSVRPGKRAAIWDHLSFHAKYQRLINQIKALVKKITYDKDVMDNLLSYVSELHGFFCMNYIQIERKRTIGVSSTQSANIRENNNRKLVFPFSLASPLTEDIVSRKYHKPCAKPTNMHHMDRTLLVFVGSVISRKLTEDTY